MPLYRFTLVPLQRLVNIQSMPRAKAGEATVERLNPYVTPAVVQRVEEARLKLRRLGIRVSVSMFVEVALNELCDRRDLPALMRRCGATARRELKT